MKKGTVIALILVLIYCLLCTIEASTWFMDDYPAIFPDWLNTILYPGLYICITYTYYGGLPSLIIGQIITFFLLFYILKTILNSLFKKSK